MEYGIEYLNPYIVYSGLTDERNCMRPGENYGERKVRWYEIELITWGEGHIITDGKTLEARRGNLFFRKPGTIVNGFPPYHFYIIIFDAVFDSSRKTEYSGQIPFSTFGMNTEDEKLFGRLELGDTVQGLNFPHMIEVSQYDRFEELFAGVLKEFLYKRSNSLLFQKSQLMQILQLMHKEMESDAKMHHERRSICLNYPRIMDVKSYIDSNIELKFNLNELANIAGLSPNFFCKIFKEIIGETPINYINRVKINRAKKLLIETNMEIKEIAFECGFENYTYFYILFKKLEGVSPLTFRESQHTAIYI